MEHNPDLIADALDEFRAVEAISSLAPTGAAAVRATVAHRRRVKGVTLGVIGAMLIAVPIAAFAAHPRGNNPPPVGESPSGQVVPSPSPSTARDARFTTERLAAAKAPLPAGAFAGCPDRVTATRPGTDTPMVYVEKVVHTNLDSDPALETAAWVVCALYDKSDAMVVAYTADDAGKPVVLGTIFKAVRPNDIVELRAGDAGGVVVTVVRSAYDPELGEPDPQAREFAWDGTAFKQVGGPSSFEPRQPADLSLTAGPLNLGPARGGKRGGTITVTVKNLGPSSSMRLGVEFGLDGLVIAGQQGNVTHWPPLQSGETMTYHVQVEVPADNTQTQLRVRVASWVTDANVDNDFVDVAMNRA